MKNNKIWKNIDWINKEEKREFFNKYFNNTKREFVTEEIEKTLKIKKQTIIEYINSNIKEKNQPERKPKRNEIINFVESI